MKAKRIIIADNEENIRNVLSFMLEDLGHEIITAENGQVALERILEGRHKGAPLDLLITDIQMPKLTGLELMDELTTLKVSIPTIAITGYGDKEMLVKLLRNGCDDYLDKPLRQEVVLKCVETVLARVKEEKIVATTDEKTFEKYRSKFRHEIASYRANLALLNRQVASAVDGYHKLVDIKTDRHRIGLALKNRPLTELGGDFVDIRDTKSGCDIILADVAGHDMGASFHTILIKAFFDENCRTGKDGNGFFQLLNQQFLEDGKNDRMVTALFLRLNLKSMKGELLSAAHPSPIMLRKHEAIPFPLSSSGNVLGIFEDVQFKTHHFEFSTGDRLLLQTDGVFNVSRYNLKARKKERLGLDGLDKLIQKNAGESLGKFIENVWRDVLEFCKDKPQDDMMLLGIEIP